MPTSLVVRWNVGRGGSFKKKWLAEREQERERAREREREDEWCNVTHNNKSVILRRAFEVTCLGGAAVTLRSTAYPPNHQHHHITAATHTHTHTHTHFPLSLWIPDLVLNIYFHALFHNPFVLYLIFGHFGQLFFISSLFWFSTLHECIIFVVFFLLTLPNSGSTVINNCPMPELIVSTYPLYLLLF